MKIEINLKIIIAIILFFLLSNLNMYFMFLFFVLIHEIMHLIVGLIIGGKAEKMYINPFGVSLEIYLYGKSRPLSKILFYLSGPLINFILAIGFFYFNMDVELKEKLIYTNLSICFFNLLPILPLDGGKILKEIFTVFFSSDISSNIMIYFSKIFLGIISLVYSILILKVKNIYILILLIYVWYLFLIEEKKYSILKKTRDEIKKYNNLKI